MPLCASPGSIVVVRDQQWQVARIDPFEHCAIVTLEAAGRGRLRVIDPFDRITPAAPARLTRRHRRAVVETVLASVFSARPATGLWTAAAATIDLIPYQLEPALAVLRGATRILLADAVGLGKTIQASLIVAELRERALAERVLILCPVGVRAAWAEELRRFGIAAAVFDQASIADTSSTLPPGVNPWMTHGVIIASIDFIKRPEVIAAIAGVPFDIVVVDEAHHLSPGTDRGDAAHALASRAPWCVLATATPHSGDEAAFDYLTRVGSHGEPLTIFRRTRVDAGLPVQRRERIFTVQPASAESELLQAVERYAREMWRGKGVTDHAVQLVAITIARRAASSPLALQRTLRRRLELLSPASDPAQSELPWEDEYDGDDCGSPALLARPGLHNEREERAAIEHLLELAAQCETGAKLKWIARAVARINEPVIVFSEYRDTIDALHASLPNDKRVALICGATPVDRRRGIVGAFNDGRVDVLLATDTAGEGLNLHHRCRLVIDVELPWNPMRLEQRFGRVDRLGQRCRVHAWRLLHARTIESRVLERLTLRRERVIAAAVFDSHREAIAEPSLATARVNGVNGEHTRLVAQRRFTQDAATRPVFTPPARRTNRLLSLHSVTLINEQGSLISDHRYAAAIDVTRSRHCRRTELVKAIRQSERLQAVIRDEADAAVKAALDDLAPLRAALSARLARIRAHIEVSGRREVQRSLFDGRADAAAAAHNAALAALDLALQRRLRSIDPAVNSRDVVIDLIAIWPASRR